MAIGAQVANELSKAGKEKQIADYRSKVQGLGFHDARHLALSMGVDPFWSAEHARTAEGYFRVAGGMELAVARANAFAPYADLLWMESSKPYISQVRPSARTRTRTRTSPFASAAPHTQRASRRLAASGLEPSRES